MPGINIGITQPISDMVFDMVGGAHSALVIRVVGDDFTEDRRIASEIVDLLRNTRGTAEASIFQEPPLPQIDDRGRPGRRRPLRHQHFRYHEPDPERRRRRRRHPGLCRRPRLRRERSLSVDLALRSGGDRQSAARRRAARRCRCRRSRRSRSTRPKARSRARTPIAI